MNEQQEPVVTEAEPDDGSIVLDLTDEEHDALIMWYIRNKTSEVTRNLFNAALAESNSVQDAALHAVLNEAVNGILAEVLHNQQKKTNE